jgi:U3 small nucleolar RNA-associated protein 13
MWSVVDHCLLRTFEGHTASVLAVKFVNRGSQLVSASADGLIRVWTIRSGECEATLDTHTDRVWALECLDGALTESSEDGEGEASEEAPSSSAPNMFFFSGGSDSRLIQWKDATAEEERTRMHEAERNLVLEQQMQNDLRNKRYDRALATALDLGHSLKVLNILTAILEVEGKKQSAKQSAVSTTAGKKGDAFTSDWSRRLDPYVKAFTPEQLDKVVTYLKEWNTNARHCYTSQVLLHALLRLVRAEELMKHRVVLEALPALLSYSERHYQRLDRLNQASYMLDYFASMIALLPAEEAGKGRAVRSSTKPATTEVTHSGDADEPLVLFKAAAGTDSEATDDDDESSVEETVVKTAKVAAPSAISGSASAEKGTKRKAAVDAKPSKGVKKTKGKV